MNIALVNTRFLDEMSIDKICVALPIPVILYANPEDFLQTQSYHDIDALIILTTQADHSGAVLQKTLNDQCTPLPTVFISTTATVPKAIAALKEGAIDFLINPTPTLVKETLAPLLTPSQINEDRKRFNQLSARQKEILALSITYGYSKVVAAKLSLSLATVETHRSQIFTIMQVKKLTILTYHLAQASLLMPLINHVQP